MNEALKTALYWERIFLGDRYEFERTDQKITNNLRFLKFRRILEEEFQEEAIEDFWVILESNNAEKFQSRLRERLGKMDAEDADWIIDVYGRLEEEEITIEQLYGNKS